MKKLLFVLMLAGAAAGLVYAFTLGRQEIAGERVADSPVDAPTRVRIGKDGTVVCCNAEEREREHIELGELVVTAHQPSVRVYGTVLDPQDLIDLRGQLEAARADIEKSAAAVEMTRLDRDRQKALYDQPRAVSEKNLQLAENAYLTEQATLAAGRSRVATWESTCLRQWGPVIGDAMLGESAASEKWRGMKNALLLLTLPQDAGTKAAPTVRVREPGGREYVAKWISAAPRIDPKLQGRSHFYEVENGGEELAPAINLEGAMSCGEERQGVVVPYDAVVWQGGRAWAYQQREADEFARREVPTGERTDGGFFQAGGKGGDTYVLRGAQVLLSEEFRSQVEIND
ncbi:hypothetical protein KBB96_10160 [Luteolibacter ambystomatis]|uniref:Efflux RND transporter periplasmic adaptor subunit n=1 Tax=Luteolibacter ambystomatis TaxID=2824561 RepID=A0A975J383_9BACT|nr:hypothetical protein [Luteolibacter ambystomatis]QUE53242.1 hypothetical protein KBB96_10160 [Luteolibacter ambystomatis]